MSDPSPDEVRVERLDRTAAARLATALAALDDQLRAESGPAYSHESWDAGSFLATRDGKWDLSHVAIGHDGALAGFWIASRPDDETVHTHRVGVASHLRQRGVARRMLAAVKEAAVALGLGRMTLTVGRDNSAARSFYRRHGFRELAGSDLAAYAGEHGQIVTDDGVLVEGHPYVVMILRL